MRASGYSSANGPSQRASAPHRDRAGETPPERRGSRATVQITQATYPYRRRYIPSARRGKTRQSHPNNMRQSAPCLVHTSFVPQIVCRTAEDVQRVTTRICQLSPVGDVHIACQVTCSGMKPADVLTSSRFAGPRGRRRRPRRQPGNVRSQWAEERQGWRLGPRCDLEQRCSDLRAAV